MPTQDQLHAVCGQLMSNVRSDAFIPVRKESFTLLRQRDLTAESAIYSGKLATDVTAADNEEMGWRMNPVQKFIAIDYSRILRANVIRTSPRGQDDVVRFNFLLLLIFARNPDSIFIDQCSAPERYPDIQLFQICLQLTPQSSARSPLCFHPLHQRIGKQICLDSVFFPFEKLPMEPRGCVKSANSIRSWWSRVPPSAPLSMTTTLNPFFAAKSAASLPPEPVPMTAI